ncbi:MAG: FeoB-associated Cys-rich membrane protein [Clostridia bacterium]|nr:FeoB-associated Cys-rich membrane protein [Clostridia bacterium]
MRIEDIIVIVVLVLIAAGISFYLYREKKKGNKCVGCPYGKSCSGSCQGNKK